MDTYEPILSGPLNLYNVSVTILGVIALAVVLRLALVDVGHRAPFPNGTRALVIRSGIGLLVIGAVLSVLAIAAAPTEAIPPWGVFYVLPATLLAALAVLAVLRPAHAGIVLLASSVALLLVMLGLGAVADAIDPRWAADQIDSGAIAAALLFFCAPAGLAGFLLLLGGERSTGSTSHGTGAPHPA